MRPIERLEVTSMTDETYAPPFIPINRAYEAMGDLADTYASKISMEGVYIRTRDLHPVGTTLTLAFAVFLGEPHIVHGEGVVVRVDHGPQRGMEIRFTSLTDESWRLVDHVVRTTRL